MRYITSTYCYQQIDDIKPGVNRSLSNFPSGPELPTEKCILDTRRTMGTKIVNIMAKGSLRTINIRILNKAQHVFQKFFLEKINEPPL